MRPTMIEGLPSPASSAPNAPRPTASPAFKMNLRASLRLHPRLAAAVTILVLLAVVGFALTRKPMYEAESLVYVDPVNAKVLGDAGSYDPSRYDSYLQQQMQTAVRSDILSEAIDQLPAGVWRGAHESMDGAVDRLGNSLKVKRVGSSYQVSISLDGPSATNVALIVNAVVNQYLEQGRKDEHTLADQRLSLLDDERTRVQTELDQDKVEMAQLSAQLGVANPVGDGGNAYDLQLEGLRTQLAEARQAHDVAAAQLASVTGVTGAGSPGLTAAADDSIANDAELSGLKSAISGRKAALSSQMAGLTPANPVYKQDQDELAELDRSEERMTTQLRDKAERRLQDRLRLELERTGDVEARLNDQLAHQTAAATGATPKLQRSAELAADIQRLTLRHATVDDAIRGIRLETSAPGLAHVSVPAKVPSGPQPSRRLLLLAAALPLGLLAGAGAAVFARKRDLRVYTGEDVREVLGFPPIGVLPARGEVSGAVLEEYGLRLAAGLASAFRRSGARTFALSAASPTVEIGDFVRLLRDKLEELGFRAKVVRAAELLAPSAEEAVAERAEILRAESAVHEGFASINLKRLRHGSDMLLIEAEPLLQSAETEYLVRCADATILVAECGVTVRGELYQAAVLLDRLNVAGIGAVLQELHLRFADPAFREAVAMAAGRQGSAAAVPVAPSAEPVVGAAAPVASVARHVQAVAAAAETPIASHAAMESEESVRVAASANEDGVEMVAAPAPIMVEIAADQPMVAENAAEIEPLSISGNVVPFALKRSQPEVEMSEESRRSWFDRLFSRGSDPLVSILPNAEGQPPEESIMPPAFGAQAEPIIEPLAVRVVQGRFSQDALDLPLQEPAAECESFAAASRSESEGMAVTAPQPMPPPPFQPEATPAISPSVAKPSAEFVTPVIHDLPEVIVSPVAISPTPSATVFSTSAYAPPALGAPAVSEAAAPATLLTPRQTPERPLLPERPLPSPVREPLPPAPVTTGRWEPGLVPRLVSSVPVSVSGEGGVARAGFDPPRPRPIAAPMRAFEDSLPDPSRPQPVRPVAAQPRPEPAVTRQLSRRWKLLSRFDTPQGTPQADSDDDTAAPSAAKAGGSSRQLRGIR